MDIQTDTQNIALSVCMSYLSGLVCLCLSACLLVHLSVCLFDFLYFLHLPGINCLTKYDLSGSMAARAVNILYLCWPGAGYCIVFLVLLKHNSIGPYSAVL